MVDIKKSQIFSYWKGSSQLPSVKMWREGSTGKKDFSTLFFFLCLIKGLENFTDVGLNFKKHLILSDKLIEIF